MHPAYRKENKPEQAKDLYQYFNQILKMLLRKLEAIT